MIGLLLLVVFLVIYNQSKSNAALFLAVAFPTIVMFSFAKLTDVSWMVILLLAPLITNYRNIKHLLWNYPFAIPTIFLLVSYFGTFIFNRDKHITDLIRNISPLLIPWLYWIYKDSIPAFKQHKWMLYYVLVIAIYGIFEGITGFNPVMDYLHRTGLVSTPEQRDDYIRFGFYRAQSLTYWCTSFGVLSSCTLIYMFHRYFRNQEVASSLFYTIIAVLALGVLIPGSRTIIVMFCIMALSLLSYFRDQKRKMIPFFVIICLVLVFTSDFFNQIVMAFLDPSSIGGSTAELRDVQLEFSLSVMAQNPVWGNGLGTSAGIQEEADIYIGGLESIVFHTAINRGIVGLVSLALYAISSLWVVLKRKHFFLAFILVGYFFAKYNSLLPTLPETFILFFYLLVEELVERDEPKLYSYE